MAAPPRSLPALTDALGSLERGQRRRRRLTVEPLGSDRTAVRVGERALVDFSSNDYLGLARHPALGAALAEAARQGGSGSAASALVSGHSAAHARLEAALAAFTGRERALLFGSGYLANLGVVSALAARGQRVLLDRLCHASLIDGARLSGARLLRYAHADAAQARARASAPGLPLALLATDGVFSMDGDVAPLAALAALARERQAWLLVDDAHGLGVLGKEGRGSLEIAGLGSREVPLLVGTLGKSFGLYGAFVAGAAELIDYVMQRARSYMYSTALPPAIAAAGCVALELVAHERWRREHLAGLVARFCERARAAGVPLLPSSTAIQPVLLGEAATALAAQRRLAAAGFLVVAIRPPTVPAGGSRLRVTLSAGHTVAQVDALVAALARSCHGDEP